MQNCGFYIIGYGKKQPDIENYVRVNSTSTLESTQVEAQFRDSNYANVLFPLIYVNDWFFCIVWWKITELSIAFPNFRRHCSRSYQQH